MANAIYKKTKQQFLEGGLNWLTDDIRAVLVDTNIYPVDITSHEFLSHVPELSRIQFSSSFTNKTTTNGIADADDITFSGFNSNTAGALIIYSHTGSDATSRLIVYIDTGSGLPKSPTGEELNIQWNNSKIFSL